MAIIFRPKRNGRPSYQVKVRNPLGGWFPTRTFSDRLTAEEHEITLKRKAEKRQAVGSDDARKITLDEFWEVWAIENRGEITDGWKRSQDQMYRDYVSPILGHTLLSDIDPPRVGHVINRAREKGRSPQTLVHIYGLLSKMFSDAIDYYEMDLTSPVKAKHHRPKIPKTRRSFLTPDEAWQLLEVAHAHFVGPGVWLQTLAGLRPEAMHALEWDNVLWKQDQILISRAYKRKVKRIEEYPKGKDWEYTPMMPALKEYLFQIWDACGRPRTGFVVQGPKGGMISYQTYYKALKRLCRMAGLPEMDPQELRHSCSELFVASGASSEDIRRLFHHKSQTTTMRYIHRTDERLSRIASEVKRPELKLVLNQLCSQNVFPNGNDSACSSEKSEEKEVV